MSRRTSIFALLAVSVSCCLLSGCTESDAAAKANVSEHRSKLLLADEPAGAKGVIDIREEMPREGEFVIVGKIGGRANPWTEGEASFVMADASVSLISDGHGHQHKEGEECAFCRKKADQTGQDLVAIVQFIGDDGTVVPVGAQELFDINTNDTVVVRGRAQLGDDGWLVVAANGLYVRK
jgi:hypothetical protein